PWHRPVAPLRSWHGPAARYRAAAGTPPAHEPASGSPGLGAQRTVPPPPASQHRLGAAGFEQFGGLDTENHRFGEFGFAGEQIGEYIAPDDLFVHGIRGDVLGVEPHAVRMRR